MHRCILALKSAEFLSGSQTGEFIGFLRRRSHQGNCYDNARVEAFFSSRKTECFPLSNCFVSKAQARREIFEYIEIYYNNQRLHSALDYHTPHQYEAAWEAETNTLAKDLPRRRV